MESQENKTDNNQSENSNFDSSINENASARLRRLKIQQNILQKGIKYLYSKLLESDTSIGINILNNANDNIYFDQIKKMFTEIKNLYEEIRFLANETKQAKSSDIDEIQRNIMLLETKIKEFKKYLQFELETLKKEETALNENQIINKAGKIGTSAEPIKYIAPSPVKVLIESPFKSLEVQEFQEFMKRTKRFGGWNEYDHNKFIQIWNTYYGSEDLDHSQEIDVNSETCQKLIHELFEKIVGINQDDIISHIEWYTKYLLLYTCQKNALNKWKENRNTIKKYNKAKEKVKPTELKYIKTKYDNKSQSTSSNGSNDSLSSDFSAISEKSYDDVEDEYKLQTKAAPKSKLMEPTKQWLYRCNDRNQTRDICNIETVKKLSIPSWRVGLQ